MSALAPMNRFAASFQGSHLVADGGNNPGASAAHGAVLRALKHIDVVLPPEVVDIEGQHRVSRYDERVHAADDLRLPPPPGGSLRGEQLFQATQRALGQFETHARSPVSVDPDSLAAEGRMMALLGGIDRLKLEIRQRAERGLVA